MMIKRKHGGQALVLCGCAALALRFCAPALAISTDANDNPYLGIVDRNVFGLKPPPPPPDPEATKPPLPKFTLTGITTILGNKRVLLKLPAAPAKPGEAAKGEQSFVLAEGQREGELEVLEIDEKAGSVKINYSGSLVALNFEQNGLKPAAGAVPGGPPPPPGLPAPAAQAYNAAGQRNFLNRSLPTPGRYPGQPGAPGLAQSGAPPTPGAVPNAVPGALPAVPTPQPAQQPLPANFQNLSSEEQQAILLLRELEQHPGGSRNPLPQ